MVRAQERVERPAPCSDAPYPSLARGPSCGARGSLRFAQGHKRIAERTLEGHRQKPHFAPRAGQRFLARELAVLSVGQHGPKAWLGDLDSGSGRHAEREAGRARTRGEAVLEDRSPLQVRASLLRG